MAAETPQPCRHTSFRSRCPSVSSLGTNFGNNTKLSLNEHDSGTDRASNGRDNAARGSQVYRSRTRRADRYACFHTKNRALFTLVVRVPPDPRPEDHPCETIHTQGVPSHSVLPLRECTRPGHGPDRIGRRSPSRKTGKSSHHLCSAGDRTRPDDFFISRERTEMRSSKRTALIFR